MVHPYQSLDPSTTAKLFEGGPGPATTLAAAAAWAVEAAVDELSMGLSGINIAGLAPSFMGVGGVASAARGAELNALAGVMGGHCLKQQLIFLAAAELCAAAHAGLVPSVIIDENRVECAADVLANPLVLGALTGQIALLNGQYAEYWGQNAAVGSAYGAGLNTLTAALSTPPPVGMGANPAGPALAASSVAENAAVNTAATTAHATGDYAAKGMQAVGTGAGGMDQMMGTMTQTMGSAIQPLTGMFQSVPQMFQGLTGMPQMLMGAFGGMFGGMGSGQTGLTGGASGADVARALSGAGAGGGAGGGVGGLGAGGAGPGLTSYTRPSSGFEPEGGRATGLKPGLLNPAELRGGPVASGPMGGGAMPMSPAGMLGRGLGGDGDRRDIQQARIVVAGDDHALR